MRVVVELRVVVEVSFKIGSVIILEIGAGVFLVFTITSLGLDDCTTFKGVIDDLVVKDEAVEDEAVEDGVVKDGVVKDGVVKDGVVKDGVIKDGVIKDGVIKDGVIKDGVIKDGVSRWLTLSLDILLFE